MHLWLHRRLLSWQSPKSLLVVWDLGEEEVLKGLCLKGSILHLLPLSISLLLFLTATTEELLLGAPSFAFKVHGRKMDPRSWQGRLVPYIASSSRVQLAEWGELLRCAFPVSRLLSAHSHLPGWQQFTWWCLYTNMLIVYSLHASAESEYAKQWKDFLENIIAFQEEFASAFWKTQQLWPPHLWPCSQTFLSICKLTLLIFSPAVQFPSSTENLRLLATELLFLVTLLGLIRCGLWPPGAQGQRTHSSRLHNPEKSSVSSKI